MEKLVLCIIYGIEVVKYLLGLWIVFEEKCRKKHIFLISSTFIFIFSCFIHLDLESQHLLIYAMSIIAVALSMRQSLWNRISQIITLIILLVTIDETITVLVEHCMRRMAESDMLACAGYFMESIWGLLVLVCIYGMVKVAKKRNIEFLVGNGILVIIAMSGIIMAFMVAELNITKHYVTNNHFQMFADVMVTAAYSCLSLLCWVLIGMKKVNVQMKEKVVLEQELKSAQRDYYISMLRREEQTRKFRHDMNNHLICMKHLSEINDIDGLKCYLNRMSGQLENIQNICYATGNEILDIMLNEKLAGMEETIDITVKGQFNKEVEIDEMDLCIIFSNLIQNALDELARMQEGDRWIDMEIKSGNDYIRFQIKNSACSYKKIMKNKLPKSEKKNKRNHGIGLRNVKEVLEKYEGELKIDSTQDMFGASVILPIKKTV